MSMYFVGIDISKYKHDCCIISAADQQIVSKFTVKNDKDGFEHLLTTLNSLSNPEDIKIGLNQLLIMPSILNFSLKTLTTASWKLIQFLSRNIKSLQL